VTPLEPIDGIPDVVDTSEHLAEACSALARGSGPVAVDAERASGYRYGQRAYLAQFHRERSGTWLIDPTAFDDLSELQRALGDAEWILHAANQDLPCLAEVGLRPPRLFDTELAGRLLGRERVGLGPLVESELGWHLEKGHGAADWSTRPIPPTWRRYAALDVEVLLPLREHLLMDLRASAKQAWAEQEFDAIRDAPPPAPRVDPWRRTSSLHKVRTRRGLAIVAHLWTAREAEAQRRDRSPGRILPDAAVIAAAIAAPTSQEALGALPEFRGRGTQRYLGRWWGAVAKAQALAEADLPPLALPSDGPPQPRQWADRDPAAAARLAQVRAELAELSDLVATPVENLMTPDIVRRVLWQPPADLDAELARLGARPWQIEWVGPILAAALA
jgi:ribonuclease D